MGLAAEAQGVYWLSDFDITTICGELAKRFPDRMTPWELEFTESIVKWMKGWGHRGKLSWRQRRAARKLASRILLDMADRNGRHDLIARPPMPLHPSVVQARKERSAEKLAAELTAKQTDVLRVLIDGKPHPTSTKTDLHRGIVSGVTASSLERRRLVELVRNGTGTHATITRLGREAFGSDVDSKGSER